MKFPAMNQLCYLTCIIIPPNIKNKHSVKHLAFLLAWINFGSVLWTFVSCLVGVLIITFEKKELNVVSVFILIAAILPSQERLKDGHSWNSSFVWVINESRCYQADFYWSLTVKQPMYLTFSDSHCMLVIAIILDLIFWDIFKACLVDLSWLLLNWEPS